MRLAFMIYAVTIMSGGCSIGSQSQPPPHDERAVSWLLASGTNDAATTLTHSRRQLVLRTLDGESYEIEDTDLSRLGYASVSESPQQDTTFYAYAVHSGGPDACLSYGFVTGRRLTRVADCDHRLNYLWAGLDGSNAISSGHLVLTVVPSESAADSLDRLELHALDLRTGRLRSTGLVGRDPSGAVRGLAYVSLDEPEFNDVVWAEGDVKIRVWESRGRNPFGIDVAVSDRGTYVFVAYDASEGPAKVDVLTRLAWEDRWSSQTLTLPRLRTSETFAVVCDRPAVGYVDLGYEDGSGTPTTRLATFDRQGNAVVLPLDSLHSVQFVASPQGFEALTQAVIREETVQRRYRMDCGSTTVTRVELT